MPKGEIREALLRAAAETLRPIARRLVASGVPFGQLESRLRELFVEVAEVDLALPGRRQTLSRLSLLTGINRKEIRRIRAQDPHDAPSGSFSRNQAASLISRWMSDRGTKGPTGRPRPIPYQARRGTSFVKLAQQVTADLPPRSLLDELVRTGAVELRPGNMVALMSDAYVPKLGQAESLEMLAEDPAELVETMLQNIFDADRQPLLQRKVFYDNLGSEGVERLRSEMRSAGKRFLREVDRRLSKYDRDRNPKAPAGERRYAGIGVYYFEAPKRLRRPALPVAKKGRESETP